MLITHGANAAGVADIGYVLAGCFAVLHCMRKTRELCIVRNLRLFHTARSGMEFLSWSSYAM